jgi:hypothetical protein
LYSSITPADMGLDTALTGAMDGAAPRLCRNPGARRPLAEISQKLLGVIDPASG